MKYGVLLILVLLVSAGAKAQKNGVIHFQVEVDNGYFEIVINDTMYLKKYKAELPPGHYVAEVWSPGYDMKTVEFDVASGELTEKHVKMVISQQRVQFEKDYKEYRMQFHKHLTVPASITLATSLTSAYFMMKAHDNKKKIFSDIQSYHDASTYEDVLFFKNRAVETNKVYNRQRIIFYSTLGVSAAMIATTIYTYKMFKRDYKEPVLNDESPFKDKFSMNFSPFGFQLKYQF